MLGIPDAISSEFKLLCKHVRYSSILCQHRISMEELREADHLIYQVKRSGTAFYTQSQDQQTGIVHRKSWITIKSHYLTHMKLYIQRFGVPRNTWVFAYEAALGLLKRYQKKHRNGKSEGITLSTFLVSVTCKAAAMVRFIWYVNGTSFLLQDRQYSAKTKRDYCEKYIHGNSIVRLEDGSFFQISRILGTDRYKGRKLHGNRDAYSSMFMVTEYDQFEIDITTDFISSICFSTKLVDANQVLRIYIASELHLR